MIQIDNTYDPLAWGSHIPPLMACLGASTGSVLELGVGHFSTPMLHAYCKGSKRKLVSVEDHDDWFNWFASIYRNDWHKIINADYSDVVPILAKDKWGVSFIDNSPGGKRRLDDFVSLIGVSDYVVVHDYHGENEEAISPVLKCEHIKHFIYTLANPPTLIASKTSEIPF